MKHLLYNTSSKIALILAFLVSISSYGQKFDKKYTEEFNTSDKVIIDVDTRHTDIEIETWNKNTVSIVATIVVEGASKERAEEIIKNWKFRSLGNKNEIQITSKTSALFTDNLVFINGRIDNKINDLNFVLPEVSVGNLNILDSFDMVAPDVMVFPEPLIMPEIENFHMEFDAPEFDYEKYKKDKEYMKKWQEKMKTNLEKMRVQWKENAQRHKERSAERKEELEKRQKEQKKRYVAILKEREAVKKKQAAKRKELLKIRKEVQEKRSEEMAQRRLEVRNILADRDKVKIKRTIHIKAPQDAKFNMNVRYGSMSFPKN